MVLSFTQSVAGSATSPFSKVQETSNKEEISSVKMYFIALA
jgi:hypothetical protein